MKLRIWTLAAALMIVIAFGLALPSLLSNETAEVAISYEQVKSDFKAEFVESFAALYHEDEAKEAPDTTQTAAAGEAPAATLAPGAEGDGTVKAPANTQAPKAEDKPAKSNDTVALEPTEITEGDTPLGGGEVYVKDGWVNQKINDNREKIDDSDLARGSDIYNRLDTDFIFGLADGGLTPEERAQVDTYLKSQLTGTDYELARALYDKYVGLLNND